MSQYQSGGDNSSGGATVDTLTGNSGGAVGPDSNNNINTVGTGSITIVGNPSTNTLTTELTGLTQYDVLVGQGSATIGLISPSTSGYVLTSNGSSAYPTFQAAAVSGIVTLDGDSGSATGTTVTISGGSTGLTTSASGSTMDIVGVLTLASGGTSADLTASNGGIFYSTASAGAILAGTATARQMLQSGASTTPAWSTATWPATTTINQLLYSSSANTVAGVTAGNYGVLISSSAGVPSWLANGTTGQILTATSSGIPSWENPATSGTVTTVSVVSANGFAGTVANATSTPAITLSTTITGVLSGNGTAISGSSVTQHGVLVGGASNAVGSTAVGATGNLLTGNTGADPTWGISYSTTATASTIPEWDSHVNLPANNFNAGYTTTATAAGTTTLTVSSSFNQYFTGSTTQTVQMPVTSTLVLGQWYQIVNSSTGQVTVQSSGSNNIVVMNGSTVAFVQCILTSGTTAASWNYFIVSQNSIFQAPTTVNHAASPYTVLTTDTTLLVDTSSGTVQLNFPNTPNIGQKWFVKDSTNNFDVNACTITTAGGTDTIDGSTTFVMTTIGQGASIYAATATTYYVM